MADKQEEGCGDVDESSRLRGDLVAAVSQRLGSLCKDYSEEVVAKVLRKRRRKWQRRHAHKLGPPEHDYRPVDPALQEVREARLSQLIEAKSSLSRRRKDSFSTARQLQRDTNTLCHQVLAGRLAASREDLHHYRELHMRLATTVPQAMPPSSSSGNLGEKVVENLEDTLSQAQALASIRKMKFQMTPRVPTLHSVLLDDTSLLLNSTESGPFVLGKTVEVNTTLILEHGGENEAKTGEGGASQARGDDGGETTHISPEISNLRIVSVQTSRSEGENTFLTKPETQPVEVSVRSTSLDEPGLANRAVPATPMYGAEAIEVCATPIPEYEREISVSSTPEPETDNFAPTATKSPRLDVRINGSREVESQSLLPRPLDITVVIDSNQPSGMGEQPDKMATLPDNAFDREEIKLQRITKVAQRGRRKRRRGSRRKK